MAGRFGALSGNTPSLPTNVTTDALRHDTVTVHPMSRVLEDGEEESDAASGDDDAATNVAHDDSSRPAKTAVVFTTDIFVSMDVFNEVPEDSDDAQRYLGKGSCCALGVALRAVCVCVCMLAAPAPAPAEGGAPASTPPQPHTAASTHVGPMLTEAQVRVAPVLLLFMCPRLCVRLNILIASLLSRVTLPSLVHTILDCFS